jgi:hypothetical protein
MQNIRVYNQFGIAVIEIILLLFCRIDYCSQSSSSKRPLTSAAEGLNKAKKPRLSAAKAREAILVIFLISCNTFMLIALN